MKGSTEIHAEFEGEEEDGETRDKAPVAGFAIDHGGWPWGFAVVSVLGVLIAATGWLASRRGGGVAASRTTPGRRSSGACAVAG